MSDTPQHCPVIWPRAIIHIDMNAFFASIEQRDFPELRNKPIAITNGLRGSTIITCSYEARAFGIHTGMKLREARQRCPQLLQRSTRPVIYTQVSTLIMQTLKTISPDIEIFSVDEAFLDVTHCQHLYGTPPHMALLAKQRVFNATGLLSSAGISGDKTTAKYASKLIKPDGLTTIPPWETAQRLHNVPVSALCGIGKSTTEYLARHGAHVCGDVVQLPIGLLAKRYGNIGRRIWLMCQGKDSEPLRLHIAPPKSLGHGKILPPNTRDKHALLAVLHHMSDKVTARLRRHDMEAQHFFIGLRINGAGQHSQWLYQRLRTPIPTQNASTLFKLCQHLLNKYWQGEVVYQVQVIALTPHPQQLQTELFANTDTDAAAIRDANRVIDSINQQFGALTISPARALQATDSPDVIAPSWQPDGHRQSITP